jgi:WD40 repeat protein
MDDASTVASNDAAILLDDSTANFIGHTDAVYWSSFHPSNNTIVVTASGDDTAGVWSSETNAMTMQLRGHTDTVNWAAFNAAGTLIATASLDSTVKVWDAATGALRHSFDGPSADILWATWHPRGNVILAGSEDCSAWMWNADDGACACMGVFTGHTAAVSCGGFSPDGRHVWTAAADASLRFWSPRTFACVLSVSGGLFVRDAITCAAVGANYAVAGGDNGDLRIVFYRVEGTEAAPAPAAKVAGTFTFDSSVESTALNSSETLVAAGLHNGSIVIIDCVRMLQRCVLQHKDSVTQVLFHPTTDYALFSSAAALDCSIRFWDCRRVALPWPFAPS